jgi:tRNA(adenine34) deaminase
MTIDDVRARDEHWMHVALSAAAQARQYGEVPIGVAIVKEDELVAVAHNWRETWADPTAHAEVIALSQAARRLGGWRLDGCTLYVTLEPCPMCAGAIMLSRVERIVYGAVDAKGGAIESKVQLYEPGRWNHHPETTGGVLADECGMILKDFFRALRANHQ